MKFIKTLTLIFVLSLFNACKKDKNKPKDPNSQLPSLLTGNNWTVENKYKIDLKNYFLVSIDNESVVKFNNEFYWKLKINANDPIFGGSFSYAYFKFQNATISEFVPQALNFDTKTDAFYFLENDTSERAAVLNNGFKLFKNKTPTFTGWDLLFRPIQNYIDLHFAPHLKYSVCYNIANYSTITTLNLENGKFARYRNYGGLGLNNGSFAIDEKYNIKNPNSFKAYHSSVYYTGNYKMKLFIGEICDTIKNKYGDPSLNSNSNDGYYNVTNLIDTNYLADLGGIGYNFGDGYTKSVDADDKVYIFATCKGMADKYRLYSFNKSTRKLSFLYTHNGINNVTQMFYRKGKNDLILNTDKGLFKLELNSLTFSDISPTLNAKTAITKIFTQPYSNGSYSNRIYGVVCSLNALTTTSNLVYYE